MEKYDYYKAVLEDVTEYIEDNYTEEEILAALEDDRDSLYDQLYDNMFISDSVTGNASGSYTFSTWKAEEYLCHNLDLLEEAADEFGDNLGNLVVRGAEVCDVTIRCYLLGGAINEYLDELA